MRDPATTPRSKVCGKAPSIRQDLGLPSLRVARGDLRVHDDPLPSPDVVRLVECAWDATVLALHRRVPSAFRSWALAQIESDTLGARLLQHATRRPRAPRPNAEGYDALWRLQCPTRRTALGQYFTPPDAAALVVRTAGVGDLEEGLPSPRLLDPACGTGVFLRAALAAKTDPGARSPRDVRTALGEIHGLDRDPVAVLLAKLSVIDCLTERWAGTHGSSLEGLPPLNIWHTKDSLAEPGLLPDPDGDPLPVLALKRRSHPFDGGFGFIVGNPPYLEAKRMNGVDRGMKARLKAAFPQLQGAFDLYMAFLHLARGLACDGGHVVMVLPNKFLVSRYAESMRRDVLARCELRTLIDVSTLRDLFPGTSVYPIIVHLSRTSGPGASAGPIRAARIRARRDLPHAAPAELHGMGSASLALGTCPFFVPSASTWPILETLLRQRTLLRLGQVADVRSTCSFHAKGLRERYVRPADEVPPGRDSYPYLGGVSFASENEVDLYRLRPRGFRILYEERELRDLGNPLPPLDVFLRPKAIFCQHSQRMRAFADIEGRWVTKDVYPIALPHGGVGVLGRLAAILNSTVFTAIYNTLHHGIAIGGGYYHYLPAFLDGMPVPPLESLGDRIESSVLDVQNALGRPGARPSTVRRTVVELDRAVTSAYGLTERERTALGREHLRSPRVPTPRSPLAIAS